MIQRLHPKSRPRLNSEAVAHTKKGFNLIETAIVIGVVGLVIGGIWVAASAVNDHFKVSQTAKDVLSICDSTTRVFNMVSSGAGRNDLMATIAADAGVLPETWVVNGAVQSPIGGSVFMSQFDADFDDVGFWGKIGGDIAVYLTDVPQKYCRQFLGLIHSNDDSIIHGIETGIGANHPDPITSFIVQRAFPYNGNLVDDCGNAALVTIDVFCRGKH